MQEGTYEDVNTRKWESLSAILKAGYCMAVCIEESFVRN